MGSASSTGCSVISVMTEITVRRGVVVKRAGASCDLPHSRAGRVLYVRSELIRSGAELCCVMTQVVFHEGGDEVVAVVVAVLHAQRERGARLPAAVVEHLRVKLLRKKLVRGTLIDEDRARKRPLRDQDTGVVFCPGLLVRPQVAAKRFLPPGAAHGRGDRRKGRYRAVLT